MHLHFSITLDIYESNDFQASQHWIQGKTVQMRHWKQQSNLTLKKKKIRC